MAITDLPALSLVTREELEKARTRLDLCRHLAEALAEAGFTPHKQILAEERALGTATVQLTVSCACCGGDTNRAVNVDSRWLPTQGWCDTCLERQP